MSLILDALKKSHRERESNAVPDLDYWVQPRAEKKSKNNWPLIFLGLILAINLVAVVLWIKQSRVMNMPVQSFENLSVQQITHERMPAESYVLGSKKLDPKKNQLASEGARQSGYENEKSVNDHRPHSRAKWSLTVEPSQNVSAESNILNSPIADLQRQGYQVVQPGDYDGSLLTRNDGSGASVNGVEVLSFSELPFDVQQSLPDFNFVSHIYTDESSRRSVIIDQTRFREGDTVDQDLTLERIEKDSVVMDFAGFVFRLPVEM